MTNGTWQEAWNTLESKADLSRRGGQQLLGNAIFSNVFDGGQLVAEGPTGVGKSLTALIPAICVFKEKKQRTILTTETLSLLDQIVDKDLPLLRKVYGDFKYFGLKGRNHYLCIGKAGVNHPVVLKVRARLEGTLGERRDVERILGYRMDDEDWGEISGDTEFCAHNRCNPEACWSTAAREKAMNADIVVTSHKMLQVHGEFIQQGTDGGLLGDFAHIIVDEAHSLQQIVVDGSTLEVAPWELYQKLSTISKGTDALGKFSVEGDALGKRTRDSIQIIQDYFEHTVGKDMGLKEWKRQSELIRLSNVHTTDPSYLMAMDSYENTLPDILVDLFQDYADLADKMRKEAEDLPKGKGKVNKAVTACNYMAKLFYLVSQSITNYQGTVEAYGTTYALFMDGTEGRTAKGDPRRDVRIRAVPLDVSQFLRKNLWSEARSVTMISATLRDHTDGSFRFLKRSLGLDSAASKEIVVASPFNFSDQQLVYLTPGTNELVDLPGARYSIQELKNLIQATDGRSLVLFTSLAELEYAAENLRADKSFPYTLLVQEKGADKTALAQKFKDDKHSVLLGSKTFFQGFDVPGEALTALIMAKYSLPQYNATTKAIISHWRNNGFPKWYEAKSAETFVQAFGRLIRSDGCRGVVALLDERVADPTQSIHRVVHHVIGSAYGQVEITNDIPRVKEWLDS